MCGSGGHCAHQRQRGACTCGRVASGGGGGGGALRRAALGVGRRARGRASGEEVVGVGGGEGGGVVAGGGERLRRGGCWGGGGERRPEPSACRLLAWLTLGRPASRRRRGLPWRRRPARRAAAGSAAGALPALGLAAAGLRPLTTSAELAAQRGVGVEPVRRATAGLAACPPGWASDGRGSCCCTGRADSGRTCARREERALGSSTPAACWRCARWPTSCGRGASGAAASGCARGERSGRPSSAWARPVPEPEPASVGGPRPAGLPWEHLHPHLRGLQVDAHLAQPELLRCEPVAAGLQHQHRKVLRRRPLRRAVSGRRHGLKRRNLDLIFSRQRGANGEGISTTRISLI